MYKWLRLSLRTDWAYSAESSKCLLFNSFCVVSSLRKGSAKQAPACASPALRRPAVRRVEGATPLWSQESTQIAGFPPGLRGEWPEDELCPADER